MSGPRAAGRTDDAVMVRTGPKRILVLGADGAPVSYDMYRMTYRSCDAGDDQ
jgi:hypothetical protein